MLWSASAITILNLLLLLLPMNLASISQQLSKSSQVLAIDLTKDVSDAVLNQRQFSQADIGWLSNRVMTLLWRVVAFDGMACCGEPSRS